MVTLQDDPLKPGNIRAPFERFIEKELELLCEELDEGEYDEARGQWKAKMLPVGKVLRRNRILENMWWEKRISYDQWQTSLTKWLDKEFEK